MDTAHTEETCGIRHHMTQGVLVMRNPSKALPKGTAAVMHPQHFCVLHSPWYSNACTCHLGPLCCTSLSLSQDLQRQPQHSQIEVVTEGDGDGALQSMTSS